MTRNGKIARLPRRFRDELNQRLDDGEQGRDLVQWLNRLDEVKKILAAEFGGRPINEQNLSDWKQGGFRDWQRQQEAYDRVRRLFEHSDDLDDFTDEGSISDRLAAVLAAELAVEAQTLLVETTDPRERWRYLRQALRQLHWLRQGDYRAARARVEMERWEIAREEREREQMKKAMEEAKEYVLEPIREAQMRPVLVTAYGGGEAGEKAADFILEIERKYRTPISAPPVFDKPPSPPSNQAQSR